MTSGQMITYFMFGTLAFMLAVFIPWELIQNYRKSKGNKSALTLTQYVTKQAREGSKFWFIMIIAFPIFLIVVGGWLLLHFEGLCYWQGWLCELSRRV